MSCHFCKFFVSTNDYSTKGECRRWPPEIMNNELSTVEGDQKVALYPIVEADRPCGEYQELTIDDYPLVRTTELNDEESLMDILEEMTHENE